MLQINDFNNARDDLDFIDQIETNTSDTDTSRLGNVTDTRLGRVKRPKYVEAVAGAVWAPGIDFTRYDHYLVYSGNAYALKTNVATPKTTGATPDADFEIIDSNTSSDVSDVFVKFGSDGVSDFTDFAFATIDDMQDLVLVGGEVAIVQPGDAIIVRDETGYILHFEVINFGDIDPGDTAYPLLGGLYARELFVAKNPAAGSPLRLLDFTYDKMTDLYPDTSAIDFGSGLPVNQSSVLAPTGCVFYSPGNSSSIIYFNPETNSTHSIPYDRGTIGGSTFLNHLCVGSDGLIYLASNDGEVNGSVCVINPVTFESYVLTYTKHTPSFSYSFDMCALSQEGFVYFFDLGSSANGRVLKIDCENQTASIISFAGYQRTLKYPVIAGNGKMYFVKGGSGTNSNEVVVFDPATDTFSTIGTETTHRYIRGVIAEDGNIYAFPEAGSQYVLQINTSTDSVDFEYADLSQFTFTDSSDNSATIAENGKIYTISYLDSSPSTLVIVEFDYLSGTAIAVECNQNISFARTMCVFKGGFIVRDNQFGFVARNISRKFDYVRSSYIARG